jgi:hypothetical protein
MNAFYEHHKNRFDSTIVVSTAFCSTASSSPFSRNSELSVSLVPIVIFIRSAATSCVRSQRSFRTG